VTGEPVPGDRARHLGQRTARSMALAYGSYVGGRLLVLVSTAILAHLLTPKEFGLVALALLAATFLDRFADFGVAEALVIATDEEVEARSATAFRLSVITGGGVALLIVAVSPLLVDFFDEPHLQVLLLLVSLNLFVRTLAQTPYALAQRALDFRLRTAAELSDVIVRGVVSIVLALSGVGAISLMLGYLAGSLAHAGILLSSPRFRPRRNRTRAGARSMLSFGGKLTALELISAVSYNVDNAVVGSVLGSTALGYYQMAYRMPELLVYNLSVVAGRVLYPAFAAVERAALQRAYLLSLRYLLLVSLPVAVGLVLLARPFVEVLFGEQWLPAVPAMQTIVALAFCGVVGIPAGTVYKATNRVGVLLLLNIPRALVIVPGLVLFADDGIVPVALVMTSGAVVVAILGLVVATRLLGARAVDIARAAAPALAASAPTAVVLALAVEAFEDSPVPALVTGGVAGAIVYLVTLRLVAPGTMRYVVSRLRG
jgi:PST family polysaccharide transporter